MDPVVLGWRLAAPLMLLSTLLLATSVQAAPFVPPDDGAVVERLPQRQDASARARRAALARDPAQLPLALAAAREAIDRARRNGDPRELGSAQAALAPWWRDPQAPAAARLLRASILQSRHAFVAALADLDSLLADSTTAVPVQAQARLTRAALQQLQGRFDAARSDCHALQQSAFLALGTPVQQAAAACLLELDSLTGDPQAAQRALQALAAMQPDDPWLALVRAELAERQGDAATAARLYATAARGGDVYALAAHADLLLDQQRPREALAVLATGPDDADALLLRRAIAWHRLRDPQAPAAVASLRERFAAARQRGDAPHLREEARLALDIDANAPLALQLAQAQWAQQKEPADAVLLWRAARAAGQAQQAARALAAWLPDPARADRRLAGRPDAGTVLARQHPATKEPS